MKPWMSFFEEPQEPRLPNIKGTIKMVDVVFVDFHRNHGFRFFEEPQEPRLPNLKETKKWSSWSSWIFNETMDVVF